MCWCARARAFAQVVRHAARNSMFTSFTAPLAPSAVPYTCKLVVKHALICRKLWMIFQW